jgi:hypothetical protein
VFGVDGAEADAEVLGVAAQLVEVVDLVPRDVEGDGGRKPGVQVHLRSIGQLLERIARHTGLGEDLEPRPRVPERPGRELDRLARQPAGDRLEIVHAGPLQMFASEKFHMIEHNQSTGGVG